MPARPLIGLSSYREPATWGIWSTPADLLPVSYTRSVEHAGGIPVLLPPSGPDAAGMVVGRLDGLITAAAGYAGRSRPAVPRS